MFHIEGTNLMCDMFIVGEIYDDGLVENVSVRTLRELYKQGNEPLLLICPDGNATLMFKLVVDGRDIMVDVPIKYGMVDINGTYHKLECKVT